MQTLTREELRRLYSYAQEVSRQSRGRFLALKFNKDVIDAASRGCLNVEFNEIPHDVIDFVVDLLRHHFPDSDIESGIRDDVLQTRKATYIKVTWN